MTLSSPSHGEPTPSPTPRRIATPRWLDLRLVLGVVLVLASVLIGARVVSAADHTYALVGASRDLAAGTRLTAADLRSVDVTVPGHGRGTYVQTARAAVGQTLQRDVSAGELLPLDALHATSAHTTITVTLAAGASPDLRTGQRIRVWLSTATCPSVVLLSDVAVQGVRRDDGGTFSSGDGGQAVVVDVDPDSAERVVAALSTDGATVRAGVLTGRAEDEGALPDLTSCLASGK